MIDNNKVPVYYPCGKIQGRYVKRIKIKQYKKPILIKKESKWKLQEEKFL